MRENDRRDVRSLGRGVPPSAASATASVAFGVADNFERGSSEGERGHPPAQRPCLDARTY